MRWSSSSTKEGASAERSSTRASRGFLSAAGRAVASASTRSPMRRLRPCPASSGHGPSPSSSGVLPAVTRNIAIATLAAALFAGTASADTLREALVSTYNTNPTITAQREALKGTDATVAIARAAGRPQVSATAGVNQDLTRTGGGNGRNFSGGVDVSYPLFSGGSVRNQIRAAQTRVEAGKGTLWA